MDRERNLQQLSDEEYDICIIGAGASGAGCALDAALRGYKVILVEKEDFAARTSSKSTKLIHGGVRYLERAFKEFDFAQLRQVKHGLEERYIVLQNAPHLTRPLALITPVANWFEGLYFSIGLKIYGWFAAGKDHLPASKWLNKRQMLERIPSINRKMHSAVMYYDGQLDDARYCTALVQSAAAAGASVINHAAITTFVKTEDGKIKNARLRDELSGEEYVLNAKVFLNCTGPAADAIRILANPAQERRMRPSKGVHLVMPLEVMNSQCALLIPKTPDDRVVFAIPFQQHFMLGTTDTEVENPNEEAELTASEVDYLLETAQPYFEKPFDRSQVIAGFGGLRPLIAADPSESTRGLVRDHEVEYDETSGLVSLLGGKWTTYRLMAKDTIDYIAEELLPNDQPCRTENQRLVGGENYNFEQWKNLRDTYSLDEDIAQHLSQHYGSLADQVAKLVQETPEWRERIVDNFPYIQAEVHFSARTEMVCTIRDFLARRIRLEILDWAAAKKAAPIVGKRLAEALGWTQNQTKEAIEAYQKQVDGFLNQVQHD